MKEPKERIEKEGKNLGRGILKIDSVDDFWATSRTIDALARIVQSSGATLVGIATVVEKSFEYGREALAHWNTPIEASAIITNMDNGKITVA